MSFDSSRLPVLDLRDPRALRALAHPTRLAILDLLHQGPATATQCAAAVGESPSACSYHLRSLARWGFVAEADGGHGRERPWQVTYQGLRYGRDSQRSPAQRAATALLRDRLIEQDDQMLQEYLEDEDSYDIAWREAAAFHHSNLHLTPAELTDLAEQVRQLEQPYLDRTADARPPDAALVRIAFRAFRRREPSGDA